MNAKQALAQARKRWGKRAAVEDSKRESSSQIRDEATAELKRLKEIKDRTPEQQTQYERARGRSWHYRYQVGEVTVVFGAFAAFHVYGQGDTWEEAFTKADERRKAA